MQAGADFFFHVSCAKKLQGQCRRTIVGLVFRDDPWMLRRQEEGGLFSIIFEFVENRVNFKTRKLMRNMIEVFRENKSIIRWNYFNSIIKFEKKYFSSFDQEKYKETLYWNHRDRELNTDVFSFFHEKKKKRNDLVYTGYADYYKKFDFARCLWTTISWIVITSQWRIRS